MGKNLNRKKLQMWIACLVILLNALAPSISHALTSIDSKGQWVEICSADGTRYVSLDGSAPVKAPLDSVLHHLEHCPFCGTDGGAPPLQIAPATAFALTSGYDVFPALYYQSHAPLFTWSRANPRAPPTLV